jgi:hypothetical protein
LQHVFVSYDQETDRDFVENMIGKISLAGFPTWHDQEIGIGEEWRTAIDTAIRNSFVFIVVMTPEASESPYITYEWAYARGQGIKIIPIFLRETKLHKRLGTFQYLDFTQKNRPWARLLEEIKLAQQAAINQVVNVTLNTSLHSLLPILKSMCNNYVMLEEQRELLEQITANSQIFTMTSLHSEQKPLAIETNSALSLVAMKNNPIMVALRDIQNNETIDIKTRTAVNLVLEIIDCHIALSSLLGIQK